MIPLGLLLISLVALTAQSFVVAQYIHSSIMDPNWESFAKMFGVEPPPNGPNAYCLDYCAPKLPFLSGWLGIGAFLGGVISLTYIWFKPRP